MMRYLVTTSDGNVPFFTNWYSHENHFNTESGMIVYDLYNAKYTNDGTQWQPIDEDQL